MSTELRVSASLTLATPWTLELSFNLECTRILSFTAIALQRAGQARADIESVSSHVTTSGKHDHFSGYINKQFYCIWNLL